MRHGHTARQDALEPGSYVLNRGRAASGPCGLCLRERPLTFHHLIPRSLHSNKWFKKRFDRERMQAGIDLCRDCHTTVHRHLSEKELGRHYNTVESLLEQLRTGAQ